MSKRKKQYPVKTDVNLLYKDKKNVSPLQMLLAIPVFVIVLCTFSKFAVIDRLAAAADAMREAEDMEMAVLEEQRGNIDYDEVLREYQHYFFSIADGEGEEASTYVNSMDLLNLIEAELLYKAGIQSVNLTGNVLTVNLTEINLESASVIAKSLAENEMVSDVMVSSANRGQETTGTTVFLNIVLEPKKEAVEENAASGGQTGTEENMNNIEENE